MSLDINPATGLPWTDEEAAAAHQLLVKLMRKAAQDEDAERLEYWRNASMEEHARVLEEVCDLSDAIIEGRGFRPEKPPPLLLKRFLDEKRRERECSNGQLHGA